jgi:hypothetical protein
MGPASLGYHYKVGTSILDLYLVLCLSMSFVHFKCIGKCVSRWIIEHAFHDKVLGLGTTILFTKCFQCSWPPPPLAPKEVLERPRALKCDSFFFQFGLLFEALIGLCASSGGPTWLGFHNYYSKILQCLEGHGPSPWAPKGVLRGLMALKFELPLGALTIGRLQAISV